MKINWTMVSIGSRMISVVIGIIQAYIITSLMSYQGLGIQKIVLGIVALVGVVQNLGISSGSTREISAAKDNVEVSKVFFASLIVRYIISLPAVIILILGTDKIASYYHNDTRLIWPLMIMGIVLLIQASQATLKSVIQGMHKFAFLFAHQIIEAFTSLILVMYFIHLYDFIGYFYGFLYAVLLSTITLFIYVAYLLRGSICFPDKADFIRIFKTIFKISIVIYFVKIIITQWQNMPILILGKMASLEMTAVYATAIMIAVKVVTISDAVTDVTLPRNTKIFSQTPEKFGKLFNKNNTKSSMLILLSAMIIILAKREIFMVMDFIFSFINKEPVTIKYAASFEYVDLLVIAFWAYSHLNLLKAGVSVPVYKPMQALYVFIFLILMTLISYFGFQQLAFSVEYSISYAMASAGVSSYALYTILIKNTLGFVPFAKIDIQYLAFAILILCAKFLLPFAMPSANLFYLAMFMFGSIYFGKKIFFTKNA